MRRALYCGAAILVLWSASGCAIDRQAMYRTKLISTTNEIADTLALVKDRATAKEYKGRLKDLGERRKDLDSELKKLDKLKKEEYESLKKLFEEDILFMESRLSKELKRVKERSDLMEEIGSEVAAIDQKIVLLEEPRDPNKGGVMNPGGGGQGGGMGGGMGGRGPDGGGMGPPG
jgi:hypothetical protein